MSQCCSVLRLPVGVAMRYVLVVSALMLFAPAAVAAQARPVVVDATAGYAGFVDDATKHHYVAGGAVRKYVTPRLSVGPELVVMPGEGDLAVMLTGNLVYDLATFNGPDAERLTPFVVGGLGGFWFRDNLPAGPFWSADPAFTAGAGLRARITDRVSIAGEYRLGWELHQRITGTVTIDLSGSP